MKGLIWLTFLVASVFSAALVIASEDINDKLLKDALASMNGLDYDNSKAFAFTKKMAGSDLNRTIHFDPSKPKSNMWSLLSIGNRAPSEKEQSEYLKQAQDYQQQQDTKMKSGDIGLLKFIDVGSLQLVDDQGEISRYSFDVINEDFGQYLQGLISINKACRCAVEAKVKNLDEFSPKFMVKISRYEESYQFKPLPTQGSVLIGVEKTIAGKALFSDLSDQYSETYSDVKPVIQVLE